MKRIHVNAIIGRARGSRWNQSATTTASSIAIGIKRCVQELLQRKGVKGLRHTRLSLEVTITPVTQPLSHGTDPHKTPR